MGAEMPDKSGVPAPSLSSHGDVWSPTTNGIPENAYWAGSAPHGSVTGKASEEIYDKVLSWWATNFPQEVIAFNAHMEKVRARRGEESRVFTSEERAYRHAAEIPAKVYHALGFALGNKQWILDQGVREGFLRRFKDCLTVRHQPGLQRDGGA